MLFSSLVVANDLNQSPDFFYKLQKFDHAEFFSGEELPQTITNNMYEKDAVNSIENWQTISLPDLWTKNRYKNSHYGWYQITLNLQTLPDRPLAILLPKINMNVAVYINGQLLGDGGSFEEPMSRNWSRPLRFIFPAQIFKLGENTIHIKLKSYPGYGQMSSFYIGPNDLINNVYNKLYFVQVTITAVMLMGLLVLALLVFSFWLRRRQRSQYFWFLLNIVAWSVLPINMLVTNISVDVKIWEWFCHGSVALWVVAFTIFVHHFIEKPNPLLQKILLAYCLLQSIALAATPLNDIQPLVTIIYTINLLIGIYAIVRLLYSLITEAHRGTSPLAICSVILLVLSAHDWAIQTGLFFSDNNFPIYLNYLIMPIFFLFIGWYLMDEFIRSLNQVEELNKSLESKIEAARLELEEKYKTIQEIQTKQSLHEERQRLSREIHDGVSGSLTNSLMLVDIISDKSKGDADLKNRLEQLNNWLRNSLSDIRNLIFSLDTQELRGIDIFHYISDKYSSTLFEIGMSLNLSVTQNQQFVLSQTESLHLLKILQEAMNNVICHSNADEVNFSIEECIDYIEFQLKDNGKGFQLDTLSKHQHGIKNMQKRSLDINAQLIIHSQENAGSCVKLSLAH